MVYDLVFYGTIEFALLASIHYLKALINFELDPRSLGQVTPLAPIKVQARVVWADEIHHVAQ